MASYNFKGRRREVTRTFKGRVVYDRKPHRFSESDLRRISLSISKDTDILGTILKLLHIASDLLVTGLRLYIEMRNPLALASFINQIMQTIYVRLLKDLFHIGEFDIDSLLELWGFIRPMTVVPKPKPPGPI
jgi:hypothetical protein